MLFECSLKYLFFQCLDFDIEMNGCLVVLNILLSHLNESNHSYKSIEANVWIFPRKSTIESAKERFFPDFLPKPRKIWTLTDFNYASIV